MPVEWCVVGGMSVQALLPKVPLTESWLEVFKKYPHVSISVPSHHLMDSACKLTLKFFFNFASYFHTQGVHSLVHDTSDCKASRVSKVDSLLSGFHPSDKRIAQVWWAVINTLACEQQMRL